MSRVRFQDLAAEAARQQGVAPDGEAPPGAPAAEPEQAPEQRSPDPAPGRTTEAARLRLASTGVAVVSSTGELAPAASLTAGQVPAMTAVLAAYASVKQEPRSWTTHTLRLPASLDQRIKRRIVADSTATGLNLAQCHYVQAALGAVPPDLERAAAIGRAWREAHLLDRRGDTAGGSGTRLHRDTAEAMSSLARQVRGLSYKVTLQDVAAGAVSALLDELGEMPFSRTEDD